MLPEIIPQPHHSADQKVTAHNLDAYSHTPASRIPLQNVKICITCAAESFLYWNALLISLVRVHCKRIHLC